MNKIDRLKKEKDAVILAHYYVDGDIQSAADYVGDSFYLAQVASRLKNRIIVMAGVYFMGESVKILNPDKKVLLVDIKADCPMAHMITVEKIEEMRKKYDDLAVVCYVNSTAEIKAHSDVCVTSSNALRIVKKLKEKNIFFVPDYNLGNYISKAVGNEKNIILNDGNCPIHNRVKKEGILKLKEEHKDAVILAHPECPYEVLQIADFVGSTKAIINEVEKYRDRKDFIISTENGILYKLKEKYLDRNFYFTENFICDDMKLLNMEKLEDTLENEKNEVSVDKKIAERAILPLNRMLELGAE